MATSHDSKIDFVPQKLSAMEIVMNRGYEMMISQGWTPGSGLGRDLQGIKEPISSFPEGFIGRIYGGSRAPSRIGLGVPSMPGWNGQSYNDSKRFLFSMGPSKFVKPVPKKDTSKFVCDFSDEDEDIPPPPKKSKKQEMLDLMEAAMIAEMVVPPPPPPSPQEIVPPPPPLFSKEWMDIVPPPPPQEDIPPPPPVPNSWAQAAAKKTGSPVKKQSQSQLNPDRKKKNNKKKTTQVYYDMP